MGTLLGHMMGLGLLVVAGNASASGHVALAMPTYAVDSTVPDNVRAECEMPERLSRYILEAGKGAGDVVQAQEHGDAGSGKLLAIEFTDAMSRRSGGPGGHDKYVQISGRLSVGGEVLASFTARRRSSGGAGGWMKSACTVFNRINKALADDVVAWLRNPSDGASLGDPPR